MAAHVRNRRPAGANGWAWPVGDELIDDRFGALHEQITGSPVEGGKECTVEPQAGQAHHRRSRHIGPIQQRGSVFPETVLVVVGRVDVHNTNLAT